jgi:hypothetical protein
MNRNVHVRFWIGGLNGNTRSTVTLSHPETVSGLKGLAVRVRCVFVRIYVIRCSDNKNRYLLK